MKGCSQNIIRSHIHEYVWTLNWKCTVDRVKSYELILTEIGKYYKPVTSAIKFEELFNFPNTGNVTNDLKTDGSEVDSGQDT